jgi:hypothetical protein
MEIEMDLACLLSLIEEGILTPKSLSKVSYIVKEMGMSHERKILDFSIFLEQMLKRAEDMVEVMKFGRYQETMNIIVLMYAYNFIKQYNAPFTIISEIKGEAGKAKCKLALLGPNTKDFSAQVYNTINEFIEVFRGIPLGDLITEEKDSLGTGEMYKTYMNFLYETLSNTRFPLIGGDLVDKVYSAIESYINRSLYNDVFPTIESEKDKALHDACKDVCWVEPRRLDIMDKDLSYGSLGAGITCTFKVESSIEIY